MPDCSKKLSNVIDCYKPSLEELVEVFKTSLSQNFETVLVDIVNSPDISKEPFSQQSKGFGKNLKIVEVGGPGNLYPGFNIDNQFDIKTIAETCSLQSSYVFGPGAGPWPIVGKNNEMVADVNLKTGKIATKIGKIDENTTNGYIQQEINQSKFSLMANLAFSDADEIGKVVHFKVSKRIGKKNLTLSIRDGLEQHFGTKLVSLAGMFIVHEGKCKLHIMPDFPGCPFENGDEVDKWLKYYEMNSPLLCACVMHSFDPGFNLRLEHTHCYSNHGDVGHYHYDITPDQIIYEGWFALATKIYRIDEIGNKSNFK